VGTDVHDDEQIVGDEAATVGAGFEAMATDINRNLCDEVGLILLLQTARVSGGIDERDKEKCVLGELHTTGVPHLN